MTRTDVKVGDKVKSRFYGNGVIEDDGHSLVGVRFGSGSYRAYRKDDWSNTHSDNDSIEFIELIKVGDTVTLIDRPWETDVWNGMDRFYKKYFMKLKGTIWTVEKIRTDYFNADYDCDDSQNGCPFIVPIDLLRKVDDTIRADRITTGVVDDSVVKGIVEPKRGDLFRVIGNDGRHMHSVGDVVEFVSDPISQSYETYCPKTGRTQFVHKTDLEPYDGIHRHTPDQIAETQRIIGEIVADFKFGQCYYIRDESGKDLTIRYTAETADGMHTITAHCSPHDEFNRTIGIMVALCKATGRKLPDWV